MYSLKRVDDQILGVLRSSYDKVVPSIYNRTAEEIKVSIEDPYFIEILKSKYTSKIHRYSYTERIRIQKFDNDGNVCGEYRLIGLFASSAYYQVSCKGASHAACAVEQHFLVLVIRRFFEQ